MPFVDVGDLSLHYSMEGDGERKVILIHELGGCHLSWKNLSPHLPSSFTRYAVDWRGSGLSEKPYGKREVETYAADITRLMHQIGDGPFDVIGAAMGAMIAAWIAALQPDFVRKLVLISGAHEISTFARNYNANRAAKVRAEGVRAVMQMSLENAFPPEFAKQRQEYEGIYVLNDPVAYAEACESLSRATFNLEGIKAPTLVLSGAKDFIWPDGVGEHLTSAIKGSKFVVIEEAGHFPHIQTPESVARHVQEFLA